LSFKIGLCVCARARACACARACVSRLFLCCSFFCQIWLVFYDWLGFVLVTPLNISNHLAQFGFFGGFSKRKKHIIRLIWFSSPWVLWKERNARIFKNSNNTIHHLLDNIKAQSFGWLKAKHKKLSFDYHSWWVNPLNFL